MATQKKQKRTTKKETPVAFLLKRGDKFYMVPVAVIEALSPEEAFRLGLIARVEQRKQLLTDAVKGDHFINNVKVVEGLEASLRKLEELYPFIKQHMNLMDNSINNSKIGRC